MRTVVAGWINTDDQCRVLRLYDEGWAMIWLPEKSAPRKFAAQAGIDPANLYNAISGKRPASPEMLAKLQSLLIKIDD